MGTLPPLTFPSWIPDAVRETARLLNAELATEKDFGQALEILSRLISNPRMRLVWGELSKKNSVNDEAADEYRYPARVTNASWATVHRQQALELRNKGGALNEHEARLLEAEAAVEETIEDSPSDQRWSEQDRAAQLFLNHAYRSALDVKPVFLSDIRANGSELRKVAASLRKQAAKLQSLGMEDDALKLGDIAANCDDEAWSLEPKRSSALAQEEALEFMPRADDPWIITRQRNDAKVRTFVVDLSIPTQLLFGTPLYGTLANVANVVFSRDDMTGAKVREWLRVPPGV